MTRNLRVLKAFLIPQLGLLLICTFVGCKKAAPPSPEVKLPEVFISSPVAKSVTDFEEATGRLGPVKIVEMRARVSGYLDNVEFTDGSDVEKGTPLFRIDPRPFAAELAKAEATEKQMKSRQERLKRQEERLTRLSEQKVTTAEDLEAVRYQRQEADAELQAASASVEIAKLDLEFTKIDSPFAGRISRRMVDPGNLIQADVTPLVTIVSLEKVYAYFDIDERTVLQLSRLIAEGKLSSINDKTIPVQLALADETEFNIPATVNFMDNQLSSTTGTLRLRADVDNPQKLLAPGMFVRVRVPIGEQHDAILIQEEALGSDQGQRFVYVLNDKNEVEYRKIKTGRLYDGMRVIEDGLTTGDRVIVKGLQRVRPGISVNPQPLVLAASEVRQAMPAQEILTAQPVKAAVKIPGTASP